MASVEDLPADQRAVLQMVLQRARSYDEIASVLSIERASVRQRALDACDALTPDGIEPGPEQALVTDYLLSQLPAQVADQVCVYLEAADDERAWATAVAERLAPLAASPLPQIPAAAPLRSDQPAVADEPLLPAPAEPEPLLVTPTRSASPPPRTPRQRSVSSAADRERRRRLLRTVLGVCAAVIVVVVVVLIATRGSDQPKQTKPRRIYTYTGTGTAIAGTGTGTGTGTATATTPATTTTGTQILAALNLTSPVGATQTLGVAQVVRVGGVVGIVIDAQGVPQNSAHNAYGVWLYNSAASNKFLGFDRNLVGKNGKLAIEGTLPAHANRFKHLLITLETQQHPTAPGQVVLSGPFREK